MAARNQTQDAAIEPPARRERPWLYPYNRRLRHLHGISVRNVSLSTSPGRPRGNTVDDSAVPTSLKSPAKALAQQETRQLEHSRSSSDLKAIAEHQNGSISKGKERAADTEQETPTKRSGRKLRRRSTLDWQNADTYFRQQKLEDAISANMADVFFSLHTEGEDEPVYISEVVKRTMNPDFRLFNLNDAGPTVSRLEDLVVKLWAKTDKMDEYQYLVEMQLNLRSLQFIGKTIDGFSQPLPQNCILFHMKDGIYTTFLDNFTGEPSVPVQAPQRTMSTSHVLPTSSYDALMRLSTLDECVQDALATRSKLENEINLILNSNAEAIDTVRDVGFRQNALSDINDGITLEKRRLAASKRRRDELQSRLTQRRGYISQGYQDIKESSETMDLLSAEIATMKEDLASSTEEAQGQRRRICENLMKIYPINPLPNKTLHFSIRGIPLANSTFADADDEPTAAALGHVALIVDKLQYYLSVPLPYPITPRGSSSVIEDPISAVAGGIPGQKGGRIYPLHGRGGGARFRFEFGVFLLNKDIEVLSGKLGLRVLDLRQTLPNLKYLLYVASAGTGEIPLRKAGGIRGFLKGGLPLGAAMGGSPASSRRGSEDSEGSERGLMLPPPKPRPRQGNENGTSSPTSPGGITIAGNGKLRNAFGKAPVGKASGLRNVS